MFKIEELCYFLTVLFAFLTRMTEKINSGLTKKGEKSVAVIKKNSREVLNHLPIF